MLLTFTFSLAVVPFSNALYEKWIEIPVDLPVVESESPVVVIIPTERKPFNIDEGGGGSGGSRYFLTDGSFVISKGKKTNEIPTKASLKDCVFRNRKP